MTDLTIPARDEALAAVPGYRDTTAALALVRRRRAELPIPNPGETLRALVNDVADAARAGRLPDADELSRRAHEAEHGGEAAAAQLRVLDQAATILRTEADQRLRAGAEHGIAALGPRVEHILARVRDIAPTLGGVRTAEQAVTATPDARDAYTELVRLVDAYTDTRRAHHWLLSLAWPSDGPQWAGGSSMRYFAEVANVDELWPSWPNGYRPGREVSNTHLDLTTGTLAAPPWPTTSDPVTATYDTEYLLWAASTQDAQVWVPTAQQVRDAYAQAVDAVQKRERQAEKRAGRTDTPADPRREFVYVQPE
ncbi:hypothetical protein ABZ801_30610 [Actinomadura sp. NPDC047616]|uniref:hypothetical protein n=1 Tax=Actinomadura sp. NPDC047616 TaxID=3155914 RepID=UPI0033F59F4B